jgi:hypothetical protein
MSQFHFSVLVPSRGDIKTIRATLRVEDDSVTVVTYPGNVDLGDVRGRDIMSAMAPVAGAQKSGINRNDHIMMSRINVPASRDRRWTLEGFLLAGPQTTSTARSEQLYAAYVAGLDTVEA